ncbi:MAG: hypothetical protein A3B71_06325 [Gammaproteobacteria bacterium RIFCSPHIGHO2_02_FULL_42_43]|nr:MAG: hypothetical protein A3B71_06325 [Gammaproteobacteria bacterium RIFCSPHIGHO2_02_FULL_42_43]
MRNTALKMTRLTDEVLQITADITLMFLFARLSVAIINRADHADINDVLHNFNTTKIPVYILYDIGLRVCANIAEHIDTCNKYPIISCAKSFARNCVVSKFFSETVEIVIHETGHALAMLLFYDNAHPSFSWTMNGTDIIGAQTKSVNTNPSDVGKWAQYIFDKNAPMTIVNASGAIAEILWCLIALTAAVAISSQYSRLKTSLAIMAFFSMSQLCAYAYSAVGEKSCYHNRSSDFCKLKEAGVFPEVFVRTAFLLTALSGHIFRLCASKQPADNKKSDDNELQHISGPEFLLGVFP